jgi:hypothetical protein
MTDDIIKTSIDSSHMKGITIDEGISILLSYMFSGRVASPSDGKSVIYSLFKDNDAELHFIASFEDDEETGESIDRYIVVIDRLTRQVRTNLISLSTRELYDIILSATGQRLRTSSRFRDGSFSVSYKVSVEESDIEYILQLRHHGDVDSMNSIMRLVSSSIDSRSLPVPTVYPVGHIQNQCNGMGVQVTQDIPGVMGNIPYPSMTHDERLVVRRRLALAFDALWRIPLPGPMRRIGELRAQNNDGIQLNVGPDRHYSLGGPFTSVADYLRASVRASLLAFQKQQGIDEYKSR